MISDTILPIYDPQANLLYGSAKGSFFIYGREDGWVGATYSCRVQAGWAIVPATRWIGFTVRGIDLDLIDRLWARIERNLPLDQRTVIHRTQRPNVIVFNVPAFWTANDTSVGMLTLLMRATIIHGRPRIHDTLVSYPNTKRILRAVKWFLSGRCVPTYGAITVCDKDGYEGVCAEYDGLDRKALALKLIRPPTVSLKDQHGQRLARLSSLLV